MKGMISTRAIAFIVLLGISGDWLAAAAPKAPEKTGTVARLKEVPAEFEGTVRGDDPGFVRATFHDGDFHLRPGSASIGAGWATVGAPALEYAAPCGFVAREQKSRPDIGAYAAPKADGR